MNSLNSSVNNSVEWRRNKVQELSSQGHNQSEISKILQICQPTINRDLSYLKQQAKTNIKRYIDQRLPEEYEKCLVGITAILREAWTTSHICICIYITQKGKDTSIVIGKGMLFNED